MFSTRRQLLQLALALPLLPQGAPPPRRRALLIAVNGYEENARAKGYPPRYRNLKTRPDVQVLEQALKARFGFADADIRVLRTPEQTTHTQIVAAIQQWLIAPAQPGDTLYLHFSGHGGEVECADGSAYRTLVPSDWKQATEAAPDDHNEILDTELGALIKELRLKLTAGSLFASFDCCHSGQLAAAGMREAEHAVRGPDPRFPSPVSRRTAAPGVQGILSRGAVVGKEFVALMACRADQKAFEAGPKTITDPAGNAVQTDVGLLSYYLAEALMHAQPQTSYNALFEYVNSRIVIENNRQNPVLEGDRTNRLFSGIAVPQLAYTRVDLQATGELTLPAGALSLVTAGSTYTLYPEGTTDFAQTPPLGVAQVLRVDTGTSTLCLRDADGKAGAARLSAAEQKTYLNARAVLKDRSFVEDPLLVDLSMLEPALQQRVEAASNRLGLVRLVQGDAGRQAHVRLVAAKNGKGTELVEALSGHALTAPEKVPQEPAFVTELLTLLEQQARTRYLRTLSGATGSFGPRVEIRLVPCKATLPANKADQPDNYVWAGDLPLLETSRFTNHQYFTIQVRNIGVQPVYLSVFDIQPNGTVVGIWPSGKAERTLPASSVPEEAPWYALADEDYLVTKPVVGKDPQPKAYYVSPPFGTEMLKLIATSEPQDLTPLADYWFDGKEIVPYGTAAETGKRSARAAEHPLGRLMARWRQPALSRGGSASISLSDWGTASATFVTEGR